MLLIRLDMKLVLSCGHDGRILMWGPGGGVIDKIQVSVFMHCSVIFCLIAFINSYNLNLFLLL